MNFKKSICSSARCAALSLLVVFAPSLHGVFAATVRTATEPWVANRIASATNDLAQATLAKDYLVAPFRRGVNYARGDLVEIDGGFYVFVGSWSGASTADPVATGLAVELSDFRALAEALLAQSFLPLGDEGTNTQSRKTIETAYDRYGVATYTFLPDGFEIRDLEGNTLKLQNTLIRYTDASTGSTKTLDLEEMIQFANVLPMYPQYMDAAHATNPTSPYYVGNYLDANYRTAADTTAEIATATNATLSAAKSYTDQSAAEIAPATNATLSAAKSYTDQSAAATLSDALGNSKAYTDAALANYKPKQAAQASPSAALTEAYQFLDTVSQDTNGVITATKKTMRKATTSAPGMVQLNDNIDSTRTDHAATANAVRKGIAAAEAYTDAAIREQSLGGIWDDELQVWWTPVMSNGSLTYHATTNVNLNAGN